MRRETENISIKVKKKKIKTRKVIRACLIFISSTLLGLSLSAQNVPVFGWQSHFSFNSIEQVQLSTTSIYSATEKALFSYDNTDNSIQFLNKITGLSDIGIGSISLEPNAGLLAIGYVNGNLDLLENNTVTNVTTILEAPNIQEKAFRSLQIINNELWGGTDFGMIRYDLINKEFIESYQNIGQNGERLGITEFVINSDSIIATTNDGIISVSLDENTNRQDFNFWQRQLTGLAFSQIVQVGNNIYASLENDLFKRENGLWQFERTFDEPINELMAKESELLLLTTTALIAIEAGVPNTLLNSNSDWGDFQSMAINNDQFFIGTSNSGLLAFMNLSTEPQAILPEGPKNDSPSASNDSSSIQIWATDADLSVFYSDESSWRISPIQNSNNQPITLINDIDFGPQNRFISNYKQGPFISSETNYIPIHEEASSSSPLIELNGSLNVPAISYSNGKLWVIQNEVDQPLSSWNPPSDEWQVYDLTHPLRNYINDLFIITNRDKWLPIDIDRGGGVIVYNEESDRQRYLNTNGGQGGLPGREVTDIEQDQDGFIWITTNEGICFFPNPNQILTNAPLTANIPIYDGELLLRDEHLTALAVDPANRKWIGTKDGGVWLFSETGEELVQHFTAENSPLPSDEIIRIGIDPKSGMVFFTTSNGIASFRSDATEGTNQHQDVKIYPNPVEPNFQGLVVIEGLVNNAYLKLTDVSGKLVREFRANGSTATWNTRYTNGTRVSAGVYLLFSSNRDGSETYIGKIVVI